MLHFYLEPATSGLTPAQIDYVFRHPVAVFEVESRTPGDRVMAILGYVDEFRVRRIELLVSQRTRKVFSRHGLPRGMAIILQGLKSRKGKTMSDINWSTLSDEYASETPEIVGEVTHPTREFTMADLDDIFAGRPLAEAPREKATVMRKAYLTPEMATMADRQAKTEHISVSALLRKALAAYLNDPAESERKIPAAV